MITIQDADYDLLGLLVKKFYLFTSFTSLIIDYIRRTTQKPNEKIVFRDNQQYLIEFLQKPLTRTWTQEDEMY